MVFYFNDNNRKVFINESSLKLLVESKNSERAHKQTRAIIAKDMGVDINDPRVIEHEKRFEQIHFGEGKRVDWFIVLEPIAYMWFLKALNNDTVQYYLNYIFKKATSLNPKEQIISDYLNQCGVGKIEELDEGHKEELDSMLKTSRKKMIDFIAQIKQYSDFNTMKRTVDQMIEEDKLAAKEKMKNMQTNLNWNKPPNEWFDETNFVNIYRENNFY